LLGECQREGESDEQVEKNEFFHADSKVLKIVPKIGAPPRPLRICD
jgi:hypothetical protein